MAKGKKGPALFEVIRAAQQKQAEQQRKLEIAKTQQPSVLGNAAVRLMSPGYWFGSKETKENRAKEAAAERYDAPATRAAEEAPRPASHASPRTLVEPAARLAPVTRDVPPAPVPRHPVQREVTDVVQRDVVRFEPAARAPVEERHAFDSRQQQAGPAPFAGTESHATESHTAESRPAESPVTPPLASRPVVTTVARDVPPSSPTDEIARRVREEIAAASRIKETYDDVSPDPVFNSVSDLFGRQDQDDDREDAASSRSAFRSFKLPFQLNYTTGLVAGVAVLLVLGVSLIVLNARGKDNTALADSKKRPDVLVDVKSVNPGPGERIIDNTAVARQSLPANTATSVLDTTPIKPPTNVKRVVGQQYVVLLSFPPSAEKEAKELVKFLADNGVPTTAERALPGYSPSWFSVLTTKGFERTRDNAEFDQFSARLVKLMEKYAKGSKFKTFKPDVYRWRTAS